jgi:hypothetical protein
MRLELYSLVFCQRISYNTSEMNPKIKIYLVALLWTFSIS